MAEVKTTYSADNTIAIGLLSLASDANLLAGRESDEINNSVNLYIDAFVHGKIKTGTTTGSTNIFVYVWGSDTSIVNPNQLDTLQGVDGARTIGSSGIRDSLLALGAIINVTDTTVRTFDVKPFGVAQLFGGILPKFWGLFIVHNSAAVLSATATDHKFVYQGVTYTSA